MPRYYTTKHEVMKYITEPGQTIGFERGRGYFVRGKDGKPAEPVDPLRSQATQIVTDLLGPSITNVTTQRDSDRTHTDQERAATMAYYQAAAELARGIGPGIEQSYAQGADRQSVFAKGFSDGLRMVEGGSAGDANALLAQNGSPQTVRADSGAADVLFGTGGFLPAQEMETQGRAFGAAARQLPLTTLTGHGGNALFDVRKRADEREKFWNDKLAEIEAERPGLISKAMQELQQLAIQQREQALKELAYAAETGIDPLTGKPVRGQPNPALSKLYGYIVDKNGNPVLGPDGKPVKIKKPAAGKPKASAQLSRIYGYVVDVYGNPILGPDGKTVAVKKDDDGTPKPNAGLSRVYGYVVDGNGNPILGADGKRIKVKTAKNSGDQKPLTEQQKSVMYKRATDLGTKALDALLDKIWGRVDAYYEDETKAKREYQRRLRLNYGTAMALVIKKIAPDLKRLGYTQAQIRAEAAAIVGAQIKR